MVRQIACALQGQAEGTREPRTARFLIHCARGIFGDSAGNLTHVIANSPQPEVKCGREWAGLRLLGKMLQRIEYARRQALDARERAAACMDNRARSEWENAAQMWEDLADQYVLSTDIAELQPA